MTIYSPIVSGSLEVAGNVVVSGSGDSLLDIVATDQGPWTFRMFNTTFSSSAALEGFIWDTGRASIGTEIDNTIELSTNNRYDNPQFTISSSFVKIDSVPLLIRNSSAQWVDNDGNVNAQINSDGSGYLGGSNPYGGNILFNNNGNFTINSDNYGDAFFQVASQSRYIFIGDLNNDNNSTYIKLDDNTQTITANATNGYTFSGGNANFNNSAIGNFDNNNWEILENGLVRGTSLQAIDAYNSFEADINWNNGFIGLGTDNNSYAYSYQLNANGIAVSYFDYIGNQNTFNSNAYSVQGTYGTDGSSYQLAGNGINLVYQNNSIFNIDANGNVTANSFIKTGGTSAQYLMADGSVSSGPTVYSTLSQILTNGNTTSGNNIIISDNDSIYAADFNTDYSNPTSQFVIRGSNAAIGGTSQGGGNIIIQGGASYTGESQTAGDVILKGGVNNYAGPLNNGYVRLFTANTERVTVDSANGYVGIGTTSPTEKLEVNGNVKVSNRITADDGTFNQTLSVGGASAGSTGDIAASGDVYGNSFITSGGTSAQYVAGDGSLITFPTIPSVGTWGALNYPTWSSGTPFIKMTTAGTFALDTNTYLTSVGIANLTATGTPSSSTYLRGDNTWATISGTISGLTSGQVAFANDTTSITGSSNFTWNNSTGQLSTTNTGVNTIPLIINRTGNNSPALGGDLGSRSIASFTAGSNVTYIHQGAISNLSGLTLNPFGSYVSIGGTYNSQGSTLNVYGYGTTHNSNSFTVWNNLGNYGNINASFPMFNVSSGGNVTIGFDYNTSFTVPSSLFQVYQSNTGIGTVSTSGTTVTGTNTQFTNTFKVGDTITIASVAYTISAIASNTSMTTSTLPTLSNQSYNVSSANRFNVYGNGNIVFGSTSSMWYDARYGALNIGSSASQSTYKLNVSGSVNATSYNVSGGTSTQFLKANGTLDSNTYLTSGAASGSYQPLNSNLTSISGLSYSSLGFLKMTAAGTFALDTNSYYLSSNPSNYITLSSISAGTGIYYNNTTGVITSTITQYTDSNARAAISLTTTGSSGSSSYSSSTGILNIPTYTLVGLGGLSLLGGDLTGTAGSGYHGFISQSATPSTPSSGFRFYADSTNRLSWIGTNGYTRTFDGTSNTDNRVYTLPNRDITFDNITTSSTTNGTGFLKGNGSNISFDNSTYITGSAGSNGQIQFNNSGAFGASSNLQWNNSSNYLGIGQLSTPSGTPTTSTATTGGTLTASTYYYKIVAIDGNGNTTLAGTEKSQTTTGSTSTVTISWTTVAGAYSYRIYQGTVSNSQTQYLTATTNTVIDIGSGYTTGSSLPSSNTTSMNYINSSSNNFLNGITVGKGNGNLFNNTAIGVGALNVTIGSANTAVGYNALLSVTSGSNNAALGSGAGYQINTGARNLAIGTSTLAALTSGGNNVAVGYTALNGITTQSNNVAIGDLSGRFISGGSTANTGSSNSVFIGQASYPLADNQTNQIAIGYQTVGLGSNTSVIGNSSTLVHGIWGRTLIGTSTLPSDDGSTMLQVGGNISINTMPSNLALLSVNQPTTGIGTIVINSSGAVTGTGTQFTNTFKLTDTFTCNSVLYTITAISSDTAMTVSPTTAQTSQGYTLTGGSRFNVYSNGNITFGASSGTIGGANSKMWWDAANNALNIGTSTIQSSYLLNVNGSANINSQLYIGGGSGRGIFVNKAGSSPTWISVALTNTTVSADLGLAGTTNDFFAGTSANDICFKAYSNSGSSRFFIGATAVSVANIVLFSSGAIVMGATTDDTINKLQVSGRTKLNGQVSYGGTTPTIAAGTGAGTSPTVSIAGTNNGGLVTVTTGTLPSTSSTVVTITYTGAFATGSQVVLYPTNSNTALLSGVSMVYTTGTTTTFTITAGITALTAATTYAWAYHVTGY